MILVDELRAAWRDSSREHRIALAAILAIGVVLRLLYLTQPMRNDEAVTFLEFVRRPWSDALSSYADSNNHLFHTLLAKLAVGAFGDAPWALRLPALIAGMAVVAASYAATRALYGARAAIIAAGLVATSGALVLYSTNARGYSLVVLAFLLLVLLAVRLFARPARADWVAFVVVGALGLWTLPAMMYPLGTVVVWCALVALATERPQLAKQFGIAGAGVIGVALLFYSPILLREGTATLRMRFGVPADWLSFFVDLPMSLGAVGLSWSLGWPPFVALLLLGGVYFALRQHAAISRLPVGLPLAAFVFCSWLLVVTHRVPLPRAWLWLLPLALALATAGILSVLEPRQRVQQFLQQHTGTVACIVTALSALSLVLSAAVPASRETGTFRDAAPVAEALRTRLREGDAVIGGAGTRGLLAYEFARIGVDGRHLSAPASRASRVFVVVGRGSESVDMATLSGELRDTLRFAPSVLAELPESRIYLYERRSAGRP